MSRTRAELDADLQRFETLVRAHCLTTLDDPRFPDITSGIAADVVVTLSGADRLHACERIQCILRDAGLISGEDKPCGN